MILCTYHSTDRRNADHANIRIPATIVATANDSDALDRQLYGHLCLHLYGAAISREDTKATDMDGNVIAVLEVPGKDAASHAEAHASAEKSAKDFARKLTDAMMGNLKGSCARVIRSGGLYEEVYSLHAVAVNPA